MYREGARKAWGTRKKQGWHRKTSKEKKAELVLLAREKLTGSNLQVAEHDLTHRYRSNAKERDVIKAYEQLLKKPPEKKTILEEPIELTDEDSMIQAEHDADKKGFTD